jgi:hypothetical protein
MKKIWVWLLFGNGETPEKSGDFERSGSDNGRKMGGYREERGISPGLGAALEGFSADKRWRRAF